MRLICRGRNVALGGAATAATAATATAGTGGVLAAEAYLDGSAPAVLVATAKELQEDYGVRVAMRVGRAVAATRAFQWLLAALLAVWSVVRQFFESLLPIPLCLPSMRRPRISRTPSSLATSLIRRSAAPPR